MEFGVAYAATINVAATWRLKHCGQCPYIHGFDTFTGAALDLSAAVQHAVTAVSL